MFIEVKATFNRKNLSSATKQLKNSKELLNAWCCSDLTEKNGWICFAVIVFKNREEAPKSFDKKFCGPCGKFIIIGIDQFPDKMSEITKDIKAPIGSNVAEAKEEFKTVAKHLLFLAAFEPLTTPARITDKVVGNIEKAGSAANFLLWTPIQLSFLSDENLKRVLFLSPPSCGKTVLKKAKVKNLGQKGEPVVFLLPCLNGIKPLLFFHLKREFEALNIEHILSLIHI